MNLPENDTHWELTLADATASAPANQVRTLFAIIISTCFPSNALDLWNKFKDDMADDILYSTRRTTGNPELEMNDYIRNEALVLFEDMCLLMCGNALCKLGMPNPNRPMHDALNRELQREREYDINDLHEAIRVKQQLCGSDG